MSNLRWVIALRHCSDLNDNELSDVGKKQAQQLADRLFELLREKESLVILSSPQGRAQQTAEIIAQKFGLTTTVCRELVRDQALHGGILREAIERARGNSSAVVAITHYGAPIGIIEAYGGRLEAGLFGLSVAKGFALALNISSGDVSTFASDT